MRYSQLFSKTSKSTKGFDSVNATLLQKGGFVHQEMSGVYTFLPLGLRVLNTIEQIIREEMSRLGASEILMPALHPKENWVQTQRWDEFEALFKVTSRYGSEMGLGPTHEEIITPLAAGLISSYKDLPKAVFQIQTKFRDEPRAKSGLLRGREFRMKDLYSFHSNEVDLEQYYQRVAESYQTIFKRIGLAPIYTEASGGSFSKFSHEFQVDIPSGEDVLFVCESCGLAKNKEIVTDSMTCTQCGGRAYRTTNASEIGNIFQLKTRFSDTFKVLYTDEQGQQQPVLMGCYGIGSSRVMGVLVEKFHDAKGIIWPESVAPFQVHMIGLDAKDENSKAKAEDVYKQLQEKKIEVLFDDRIDASAGQKFADADLIGIPYRLVVSKKTGDHVEVKPRSEPSATVQPLDSFLKLL